MCKKVKLTETQQCLINLNRLLKKNSVSRFLKCIGRIVCHFRNALIQKLETSHTLNVIIKKIKGRTMISDKHNVANEAFKVGSTLLKMKLIEKSKVKIKLTDTKI